MGIIIIAAGVFLGLLIFKNRGVIVLILVILYFIGKYAGHETEPTSTTVEQSVR